VAHAGGHEQQRQRHIAVEQYTPLKTLTKKDIQMSERGNFRAGGRGGGGRGRGGGGDRGGRGGGGAGAKDGGERKKENILDLNKYMDKSVTVKFNGGREGEFFFSLVGKRESLALTFHLFSDRHAQRLRPIDEPGPRQCERGHSRYVPEHCGLLRMPRNYHLFKWNKKTNNPSDEEGNTSTRSLGLLVARGTLLVLISPVDGSEEIENPFVQGEDEE
jgi:U6 snRNA-associated Sm-like protein LSm7